VDCTLVKEKLILSWRYKTLAVIKRHKNHLSLCIILPLSKVVSKADGRKVEKSDLYQQNQKYVHFLSC